MRAAIIAGVCLLILLAPLVAGLGLSPARTVVDYQANLEKSYALRVLNNEGEAFDAALYVAGPHAERITLDRSLLTFAEGQGEQQVTVSMTLPADLDAPGAHVSRIVAIRLPPGYYDDNIFELPDPGSRFELEEGSRQSQLVAALGVASQVVINVPYPGTYAKAKLHISEAGAADPVQFTVSVYNFGQRRIENAYARVRILGANNEEVTEVRSAPISLEPQAEGKAVASWEGEHNPGTYYAEVYLEYDGELAELGQPFNIGRMFIRIKDLAISAFRLGEIARLDFTVESDWNEPISDVAGEVEVIDERGSTRSEFATQQTDIEPKREQQVTAYWDTEGLGPGEYDVALELLYSGQSSSELFETILSLDEAVVKGAPAGRVVSEEGENSYNLLVILVAVLIVINIAFFIYLRRRR